MRYLLLGLLLLCSSSFAAQVKFDWDASAGAPAGTTYLLYCGSAPRTYGTPVNAGTALTVTTTLNPGVNYCAVTAKAPGTPESVYSAELSVAIPLDAPGNLRFNVQLVWNEQMRAYVVALTPVKD